MKDVHLLPQCSSTVSAKAGDPRRVFWESGNMIGEHCLKTKWDPSVPEDLRVDV